MAIRRLNPNATTKLVSLTDEAVSDSTSEQKDKYRETLDTSALTFKEGVVPTFFLLKPIAAEAMASIQQNHLRFNAEKKSMEIVDAGTMTIRTFKASVVAIEENGKRIPLVSGEQAGAEGVRFEEFDYLTVTEIGGYAQTLAILGDSVKKN